MTIQFFDVYSSPIVRSFFKSYLQTECLVDWNHSSNGYNFIVSKQNTVLFINSSNNHRSYNTTIGGQAVCFTFCGGIGDECQVDFTINYSFTRTDLPKRTKIAITRWLISVWQLECANYSKYVAIPSGNTDSNGKQWRGDYYSKFNFKYVDAKRMEYIV